MSNKNFNGKKSNKASLDTKPKSKDTNFVPAPINRKAFEEGFDAIEDVAQSKTQDPIVKQDAEVVVEEQVEPENKSLWSKPGLFIEETSYSASIQEPEMTELNDDIPPAEVVEEVIQETSIVEEFKVEEPITVIDSNVSSITGKTLAAPTPVGVKPNIAQMASNIAQAVSGNKIFKLQTRTYKQTACKLIETNYTLKQGEIGLANGLQQGDPARCAKVHLAHIMFSVTDQKGFKQVKSPSNWTMVMDRNFENSVKQHDDYKTMEALGFRYDNNSKVTSFYKADAKIAELQELNPEYLQEMYDKILKAADESHSLNSKNNQFTINNHQSSSFLHELNAIYDMVAGVV